MLIIIIFVSFFTPLNSKVYHSLSTLNVKLDRFIYSLLEIWFETRFTWSSPDSGPPPSFAICHWRTEYVVESEEERLYVYSLLFSGCWCCRQMDCEIWNISSACVLESENMNQKQDQIEIHGVFYLLPRLDMKSWLLPNWIWLIRSGLVVWKTLIGIRIGFP